MTKPHLCKGIKLDFLTAFQFIFRRKPPSPSEKEQGVRTFLFKPLNRFLAPVIPTQLNTKLDEIVSHSRKIQIAAKCCVGFMQRSQNLE
jgi:hypothetical protein